MSKLFLSLLFSMCCLQVYSQTNLPTNITTNMVLRASGNPHKLTANTVVGTGVTITVMPGVLIDGATNGYKLTCNGTIMCMGKPDSMITINGITVASQSTSTDYNPINKTGTQFIYTKFEYAGGASEYAISVGNCNTLISNCIFNKIPYSIWGYYSTDTVRVWVQNNIFHGGTINYSIMSFGKKASLHVEGNTFYNHGYCYLAENNIFKGNAFIKGANSTYGLYVNTFTKYAQIECNNFSKLIYGIYCSLTNDSLKNMVITKNLFDGGSYGLYLYLNKSGANNIKINENNFINYAYYNIYCNLFGVSSVSVLDCKNNWWGTADSAQIAKLIYDNLDAATDWCKADVSNSKNAPVNSCWPQATSNTKNYYIVNNFEAIPNPVSNTLLIPSNLMITEIKISNSIGKALYVVKTKTTIDKLDVSFLSSGVYYIEAKTPKFLYQSKFVKK